MIHITRTIAIDEMEIQQELIRFSGPGGQKITCCYAVKPRKISSLNPFFINRRSFLPIDVFSS